MGTETELRSITRHCEDTYKACCLPWGWCNCICGDCGVTKYQEQEIANTQRLAAARAVLAAEGEKVDGK